MKTVINCNEFTKQPFKGVRRRERTKYSLEYFRRIFQENHYPDSYVFDQLCDTLNLDIEKLATWFQNRRCKEKRLNKENHVDKMRKELFNPRFNRNNQESDFCKEKCQYPDSRKRINHCDLQEPVPISALQDNLYDYSMNSLSNINSTNISYHKILIYHI
ncbi:hypothetical protein LOTGIDRAFT_155772 [Lottia gigantea]|uniref:Homeobox domain-containing protein n=1 Tax=Lottia gigantea TaxID=225164 RepID=V4B2N3_LOTGI|nr:hypothetical protein LOTGIDRAFT_155772 [Lottia gigantea]ESO82754.1 hypothetical protein LOTGIDRAFT_155772 [Lottia gigantea]